MQKNVPSNHDASKWSNLLRRCPFYCFQQSTKIMFSIYWIMNFSEDSEIAVDQMDVISNDQRPLNSDNDRHRSEQHFQTLRPYPKSNLRTLHGHCKLTGLRSWLYRKFAICFSLKKSIANGHARNAALRQTWYRAHSTYIKTYITRRRMQIFSSTPTSQKISPS